MLMPLSSVICMLDIGSTIASVFNNSAWYLWSTSPVYAYSSMLQSANLDREVTTRASTAHWALGCWLLLDDASLKLLTSCSRFAFSPCS